MPISRYPTARTRKLFIPVVRAYNVTDTVYIDHFRSGSVIMPDLKLCEAYGEPWACPEDLASGCSIGAVLDCGGGGNVYCRVSAKYGTIGQSWDAHNQTTGYSAEAMAPDTNNLERLLSLTSLAKGDIVHPVFDRDAIDILDTIGGNVTVWGFLVTYLADM